MTVPQAQDAHAAALDALARLETIATERRVPSALAKEVRADIASLRSRLVVLEQALAEIMGVAGDTRYSYEAVGMTCRRVLAVADIPQEDTP